MALYFMTIQVYNDVENVFKKKWHTVVLGKCK